LQGHLDAQVAVLQQTPASAPPEQVLVLETNGPVVALFEFIKGAEGLSWLADDELRDLAPDEDFFYPDNPGKDVSAYLYLVVTNQEAMAQLLSVWKVWKSGKNLPRELRPWREVFARLRDIRRWGPRDRLRETRVLDHWRERVEAGVETVAVEIELWYKHAGAREHAIQRLREYVGRAGGRWISTSLIEAIAHHAALVTLPIATVERILHDNAGVELVQCDEVRLFRPAGQTGAPFVDEDGDLPRDEDGPTIGPLGPPLVALLDGLPLENHARLAGRIVVDDPDGWSETYPSSRRRHGTEMASLILHGDLGAREAPSSRRLYVRPILRPHLSTERESAPDDELWIDLIHRAVRRVLVGDGKEPATAPTVRIFNLSIGDEFQPFLQSVSPLARLLDWLSFEHKVLFVVSAGNHPNVTIDSTGPLTASTALAALVSNHRNHRLLSPAESLNALTVGATPHDEAGPWTSPTPSQTLLDVPRGLPSVISAFGRGIRRAVKPDVLAPGGRVVLRSGFDPGKHHVADRSRLPPGQQVATPGQAGALNATRYTCGTSNAAALTSRLGAAIYEALLALEDEPNGAILRSIPQALWIKALLVHSTSWDEPAYEAVANAIRNKRNRHALKDEATAVLGYGTIDASRVLACTQQRATLLAAGSLHPDSSTVHHVPLPTGLQAHAAWRRLTMTLAYFSPINPNHRKYRGSSVSFTPPPSKGPGNELRVVRANAEHRAVRRGTVQHEVLVAERGAIDLPPGGMLSIPVTCVSDAGGFDGAIDYAMAISLEVAAGINIPLYEDVRARLHAPVRVGIRPG